MIAFINAKLVYPDQIKDGVLLMEQDKIIASGDVIPPKYSDVVDVNGAYLGPGLVDLHCHGYVGDNNLCYDASINPAEMAFAHLKMGTTSITPSFSYSLKKELFFNAVRNCKDAMIHKDTPILGMHFEGPFVNPLCGGNGFSWEYTSDVFEELFDYAGNDVLHCTYSPEMPWAPEIEKRLRERQIVMDIGHTMLSPDDAKRAVANGARIVTHLFDAMGCWRGKETVAETGVLQESADTILLAQPGLYYELICDHCGIHVKPSNLKMALRAVGEEQIILVTDCTMRRRYEPQKYPRNHPRSARDLNVTKKGLLNGSCLTLSQACRNFMKHTGADIKTAFRCASYNPAKAIGKEHCIGSVFPGREANVLIVDGDFQVQDVYFHGKRVNREKI